ncbi:Serine/threonine protein phosphatase PP1 [Aphelenchoides fujianensis]|nr:Serine/threonine protein phosphatase PP1 [Aphelenchoides fujianensis]
MWRGAKQPEGGGHPARRRVRSEEPVGILHPLHPLLVRLVRNGRRQFAFDYEELADVLERAAGVFAAENSLLEVPVPCVVDGDLHRWTPVFLGDFVDRRDAFLKLQFVEPGHVVRGNHKESINSECDRGRRLPAELRASSNGVDLFVRGHQVSPALSPRCTATRCSRAPGYKGSSSKDANTGACLEIAADMRVSVEQRQVSVEEVERVKRNRKHTPLVIVWE